MSHHALLLEGSYEWALTCLPPVCRIEGADVLHFKGGRMGIDDVRRLTAAAFQTPFVLPERHFLLAYLDLTVEAQNALLKILEEPPRTAQFYFITTRKDMLLPTLLSRLVQYGVETSDLPGETHQDFFDATYAERLSMIAARMAKKDEVWATEIIEALERKAGESKDRDLMRALFDLLPMFGTPGASKKMILEHLALILPPNTQVR